MDGVEETLQKVPLFSGLNRKQVAALARGTTSRRYQPGQEIVSEGQMGLGLYCIQEGLVRITQHAASGEETPVRTMGPGESFGELSLLDNNPRSATATAVQPTTALLLDKAQFLGQLRAHPEISLPLLEVLVKWLRESDRRAAELS
ncbi:MAG TPA: cyclic nucleotide-binding domain-containing protein [Chloroflexota bacterium]